MVTVLRGVEGIVAGEGQVSRIYVDNPSNVDTVDE
jgi:hypothetical protein